MIRVRIVSPERELYSGEADILVVAGSEGELGVLGGHAPLVTALKVGTARIRKGTDAERFFVGGGFLSVAPHEVLVLADSAENVRDIDVERAKQARERAERRLREGGERIDRARAQAALARALARLRAAGAA